MVPPGECWTTEGVVDVAQTIFEAEWAITPCKVEAVTTISMVAMTTWTAERATTAWTADLTIGGHAGNVDSEAGFGVKIGGYPA